VSSRAAAAAVAMGLGVALATTGTARANPRPLPFTYQSESLPQGSGEIEQFVDFVPTKVLNGSSGSPQSFLATQFQTEVEYGLTDRLELAIYFTFVPAYSADLYRSTPTMIEGNGSKQRVRYRLADPEAWPVDVALYGEIAENEREIELEAKIILQRRIGALRLITNLWAEREFYFDGGREWVLNPTLGATYEVSPKISLGAEGWMHVEYRDGESTRVFGQGPHVYVGPAVMLNLGKVWWTTGAYLRTTNWPRDVEPGDTFGRFWVRTVVGIGF
jgi:hypothetical protein